jgi:NDP-sugar pyrophosphorylase family protein
VTRIVRGAILAAGEGSRLRRDGWIMPKPLVPVAGVPLIEHAIRNLTRAGVRELAIIFNGEEEPCAQWVRERFADIAPRVLVRTTASSLESFREISRRLSPGPALVSTVDVFCAPENVVAFATAAERLSEDATTLAVTRLVDDERPLWVGMNGNGRVRSIGRSAGDAVTAGFYLFSDRARRLAGPPPELPRLRDFLAWLLAEGEPIHAIDVGEVVDVDRASDVEAAERLAAKFARSSVRPTGEPSSEAGR